MGPGTAILLLGGVAAIAFFGFTAKGKEMLSNITKGFSFNLGGGTRAPNSYTPQQVEAMVQDYGLQVANSEELQEMLRNRADKLQYNYFGIAEDDEDEDEDEDDEDRRNERVRRA